MRVAPATPNSTGFEGLTACDLLRHGCESGEYRGPDGSDFAFLRSVRAFARGFAEMGYREHSTVVIAVRRPDLLLELSYGAWWTRYAVCFAYDVDMAERDRRALALGGVVQICDPEHIVDEEHIRHRDVPAIEPDEVRSIPTEGPPRCGWSDVALWSVAGSTDDVPVAVTHRDLISGMHFPDGPEAILAKSVAQFARAMG